MKRIFSLTRLTVRGPIALFCEWERGRIDESRVIKERERSLCEGGRGESGRECALTHSIIVRCSTYGIAVCIPCAPPDCVVNVLNYFRKVFLRARVSACGFFFSFLFCWFVAASVRARARASARSTGYLQTVTRVSVYRSRSALCPLSIRENFSLSGYAPTGEPREERQHRKSAEAESKRTDGQKVKGRM